MTVEALKGIEGVTSREAERSKNFFALGLMSWLYHRPIEGTLGFIETKFATRPEIVEANTKAFKAGWNYGETSEDFAISYEIAPAKAAPGTYRQVSGNTALTYGLVAASKLSGLPLFLGAYPITPASDVLEQLAGLKHFGVRTFQAEDEIAASGAALGAAFGGALGVTTSAGPGIVLKSETVGLAVTLELPLVIVDVQRAGPSTGMPTKPEQADLLMVMFGRNSESPVPVVAASTPSGCFDAAIEAARIAVKYRTPVFLLSDAYLANGSEPWLIPDVEHAARPSTPASRAGRTTATASSRTAVTRRRSRGPGRSPARRVSSTGSAGSRRRTRPATSRTTRRTTTAWSGCERRRSPASPRTSPSSRSTIPTGRDTLVLGWGSTYGAIGAAARRVRASGRKVATAHLRHLNPFPRNTGEVVRAYEKVLIPEMNLGQLRMLIRAEYLVDAAGYNKVRGRPFRAAELADAITALVDS